MKKFNDEDFLLQSETARRLYHDHAAKMPIIDYHCHLDPRYIAEDHRFRSLAEVWLDGDHYKWRAMRTNGVAERYCTGDASDWERFEKWAETVPYTMRNPLYHWTHLELKTAFGVEKLLGPATAREIYDHCNELLARPEYSARGLMRRYNVEVVCTTDDPVDSLEYHRICREAAFGCRVLPAWRPDKAMAVENPAAFRAYVDRLAEVSGVIVGAAWARHMHGYGFVADDMPELAVSVRRQWRGRGIGTRLVRELLMTLRDGGCKWVSLSVDRHNPALEMYRRLGFGVVREADSGYVMTLML